MIADVLLRLDVNIRIAGKSRAMVAGSGTGDGVGSVPIPQAPPPLMVPNPIVGELTEVKIRTVDHSLWFRL